PRAIDPATMAAGTGRKLRPVPAISLRINELSSLRKLPLLQRSKFGLSEPKGKVLRESLLIASKCFVEAFRAYPIETRQIGVENDPPTADEIDQRLERLAWLVGVVVIPIPHAA